MNKFVCGEPIKYRDGTAVQSLDPLVQSTCSVLVKRQGDKCACHSAGFDRYGIPMIKESQR